MEPHKELLGGQNLGRLCCHRLMSTLPGLHKERSPSVGAAKQDKLPACVLADLLTF